jgi:acyl-CoA thioesterase 8
LTSQRSNILAIIHISDFYLLDAPLALYSLSYGTPAIGDPDRKPTRSDAEFLVTLNHTIHFHRFDGWRADGPDGGMYVELRSPWAKDGRVLAHSTIFGRDGVVVATCVQEGYILLRHYEEITEQKAKL